MNNHSILSTDEAAYCNAPTHGKFLRKLFDKTDPTNYLNFLLVCHGYNTAAFTMLEEYNEVINRNYENFWMCFGITISNIISPEEYDSKIASAVQNFYTYYKVTQASDYSKKDLYMFMQGYALYSDKSYEGRIINHLAESTVNSSRK